ILPYHPLPGGSQAQARRILGIPSGVPVLLFFGSIRPYKALATLIQAYLLARRYRPNLWIVVAGYSTDREVARLLTQLRSQTIIRLNYIPSSQVWIYHRAADVAVFPYRHITQSGALITAMGFDLPVIVTDVGAMPATVDGNGWVVPPNDSLALAAALLEAVRDTARLKQMGARSSTLIAQRHSPECVTGDTLSLYEEVRRS
ncbi:MAG: glycosyltransferase family 4 protein, partial [Chloroflexota bacterium]